MSIEEQSLRDLLLSSHAKVCTQAIFDSIESGTEVQIELLDGSVLTLRSIEEAKVVFRERFQRSE